MSWFIEKGQPVKESQPVEFNFVQDHPVSSGKPTTTDIQVYCDEESSSAPIHPDDSVRELVKLEGDLTHLSQADIDRTLVTLKDGEK